MHERSARYPPTIRGAKPPQAHMRLAAPPAPPAHSSRGPAGKAPPHANSSATSGFPVGSKPVCSEGRPDMLGAA